MAAQTSPRTPPLVLAAWAAMTMGIVWLMEIGGVYGIYLWQARLISVALAALAIAAWGVVAIRSPDWRPRSAIWPALALPLGAFAISTLFSQRPRISVEYLGYTILLVALYLLLRALLAHPAFRDRITGLTVPLALLLGVAYLATSAGHWLDWWSAVGTFRLPPLRPYSEGLTYGNPSAVMAGSVLLTTVAVAHLGARTIGRRVAVAVLIVVAAAVTLTSGSRAGWVGAGVATAVVALAWLASPTGRREVGHLLRTRTARASAAIAMVLATIGAVILAPWVLQRAGAGGEDLRLGYLAVAGRLVRSSPITGVGAGTWVADRIANTTSGETDYYIPHAHNIYAQTAAEHGVLGLLAGAIAIACLAWLILGAMRDTDPVRRRWGWAALFGTLYFGTHQLLDFYANFPAMLFAFALPVAWLDATAPRSITAKLRRLRIGEPTRHRLGAVGTVAAVTVLVVAGAGLVAQEMPASAMSRGWESAARDDWTAALASFRTANDEDPGMPAYAFARGLAAAHVGDTGEAIASLEAVADSEDLPVAWLDLAAERQVAGDTGGAMEALERALRLGDQQPGLLFAAGTLLDRAGDLDAADSAWADALRSLPSLAGDPWWQDPVRSARWPSIRDAALAGMPPELAADLWLCSGDPGRASQSAAEIADPAAQIRTRLAIAAWNGTAADRAALDSYAQDHPFDIVAVAWAGRVAGRAGDRESVARYRLWAETVSGGASLTVGEIRVASTATTGGSMGFSSPFWSQYTYRRPMPGSQLVPSLPRLSLSSP